MFFSSLIFLHQKKISPEKIRWRLEAVMKLEVSSVGGTQTRLGGETSNICWFFTSKPGEMTQLDFYIFFRWGWNQQVDDTIQLYAGFPHFLEINLMRALFEQKNPEETTFEKQKTSTSHIKASILEFLRPPKTDSHSPWWGKEDVFRLSLWVICPFFQGEFRWFIFSLQSWEKSPPRVGIVYPGGWFIFFLVFFVKKKWSNF